MNIINKLLINLKKTIITIDKNHKFNLKSKIIIIIIIFIIVNIVYIIINKFEKKYYYY